MSKNVSRPNHRARMNRQLAVGSTLLAGLIAQAYAQTAPAAEGNKLGTVVVTGIRASLESSANAKKNAVGFIDSISAEDMGKFPDSNIAESISRIPGVTMTREITGEGLQIQIRGLGTNFTRILLNGAPVASASTGRVDSGSANREVDMDFLPGELFSRVTVVKSPTASMLEGGAAGIVDMRSARPFDRKGLRTAVTLTGTKNEQADKYGNRGSALVSNTWGDMFGVLAGVAWSTNKVKTTGFESIGWTNANLLATQSSSATRNNTGGGNWTIPGTVPANAGNGLTTGATINEAFLLANNPGLSITQIDNAIIPRLGRAMVAEGSRDRQNAILSVEVRPNSAVRFYVDSIYGHKNNEFERSDMNWVGRNGSAIPLNMKVDGDCAQGCVVTKGTFANSQYFLEYRPYTEDTKFHSINPGMHLQLSDAVSVDLQANKTRSDFHRQSPTVLFQTVLGSGITTEYDNTSGVPQLRATNTLTGGSADILNTPSAFGWNGGRVNVQEEKRQVRTSGLRASVNIDADFAEFKLGGAWDDVSRRISSLNNDNYWSNIVCGRNLNVFLPGPNTTNKNGCNGLGAAGSAAADYPGYGTNYTAGATTPLQYLGSAIPNAAIPGYLRADPRGFVALDWARFAKDSNYAAAHETAVPGIGGTNTGVNPGFIQEKVTSVFAEINGETSLFGGKLRYNGGARFATTEQTFASLSAPADPRNAANAIADGGRYPTPVVENLTTTTYSNFLPSGSLAYNIRPDLLARASMSKTITRADPTSLRALTATFTDPSAQNGTLTNPDLKPYQSRNTDLGLEWYTGREGYVALAWFKKSITGFTATRTFNVPFSYLNQYGITWTTVLTRDQRTNLYKSAGLPVPTDLDALPAPADLARINALPIVLSQVQNTSDALNIKGLEFTVQQPLGVLTSYLNGFGVSANYTKVKQSGANVAIGVPPYTYNLAAYYEGRFGGFRVTKNFTKGSQTSGTGQNGITAAAFYGLDYAQVDFTSRINIGEVIGWKKDIQATFDVFNVTRSSQRTNFQFANAPYAIYEPGRTYQIGLRASF